MRQDLVCEEGGMRLDVFLVHKLPGYSRAFLRGLVDRGQVKVGGASREASARLKTGERVSIEWPDAAQGPDLAGRILFEDGHLLVLDKPAGLVMHPAGTSWLSRPEAALAEPEPSLASLLMRLRPPLASLRRAGLVHRLDRETSGILVVAKTEQACGALEAAFRERRVGKAYRAIVEGVMKRDSGTVDAPVGREGRRTAVSPLGRSALTEYSVLARAPGASLLEARPLTGRTHQIRLHLALAGHPVAGDPEHRGQALPAPPRMMLHAYRLEFVHPATGTLVRREAEVPSDFLNYWKALQGAGRAKA